MDNALEIHAHYSKLFEAFTVLPPDDIGGALFERACELWAESPWSDFGRFLGRVESYLEQSKLTPERREKVEAFLNKQKPHYERGCWLVETRPRVIELDEQDLKNRLSFVTEARGLFTEFEAIKPHEKDEYLAKVRDEVERRLSFLVHQRESSAAAQPVHAAALHPRAGKLTDFLDETRKQNLAQHENKHWREVAGYDPFTVNLLVRLNSINLPKLMALHRANWQRNGVNKILVRKLDFGCYCWFGWYRNRLIQRYPLRPRWGFIKTLALPIPTPVAYGERLFEQQRALFAEVYAQKIERERSAAPNERQYLAERLKYISRVLSNDKAEWGPSWLLAYFLEVGKPADFQHYTDPANLGEVQAKLDYFRLCLREFHDAEKQAPTATPAPPLDYAVRLASSVLPAAVGKRIDYFPQLLARLVSAPIWDTHEILDEALTHYKANENDLTQGQKFIARLRHYLETTPIDAERRERIESWAFSTKRKEEQILNDIELPEWKAVVTEADRAMLERRFEVFTTTGRQVIQRDRDLDSQGTNAANMERQIAQIEKRLAELNAASALNTTPLPDTDINETLGILNLGYTKTSLDNLLRSLDLIEDAPSLNAKRDTKPAQWVAVITALNKRIANNKSAVFRAFRQRYGEEIGELRAFQYAYNDSNEDAALCYTRALALLGKA